MACCSACCRQFKPTQTSTGKLASGGERRLENMQSVPLEIHKWMGLMANPHPVPAHPRCRHRPPPRRTPRGTAGWAGSPPGPTCSPHRRGTPGQPGPRPTASPGAAAASRCARETGRLRRGEWKREPGGRPSGKGPVLVVGRCSRSTERLESRPTPPPGLSPDSLAYTRDQDNVPH